MLNTQFRVVKLNREGQSYTLQKRFLLFKIPLTEWVFCRQNGESYPVRHVPSHLILGFKTPEIAVNQIKSLLKTPQITKEVFRGP